jgi:hypothetical protein
MEVVKIRVYMPLAKGQSAKCLVVEYERYRGLMRVKSNFGLIKQQDGKITIFEAFAEFSFHTCSLIPLIF